MQQQQSQTLVVAVHVIVSIYQTLLACFAVASLFGVNSMYASGWLAFMIVAFTLDLIETLVVALLANVKNRSRSIGWCLWHWLYNLLIGVLLLTFFVGGQNRTLEDPMHAIPFIIGQWQSIMTLAVAGFMVEIGLVLIGFFFTATRA